MYIYKTTCLINNKIYIGQCSKSPEESEDYFGSGRRIKDCLKKHGKKNFKKEILCICKSQKALDVMEEFYIKKFNSTNKEIGYNILPGTANGFGSVSPMLIKSVRESSLSKIKLFWSSDKSIEVRKEISKKRKDFFKENPGIISGKNNPMFGKFHSKYTKKIISIRTKESLSDDFVRNKISVKAEEMWDKFRKNGLDKKIIRKRADNKKVPVLMFSIDGKFIREFKSSVDVEKELGFCRMNIGTCCRKNKKEFKYQRYGYKWKYKND